MTSISERHQAALAWASAGIPVFPCVRDGKEPACAHGFHDATTDPDIINSWWSEDDFNVAMSPEHAGWAVVDLDPESTRPDFPDTYEVRTPRGGSHLYFTGSIPTTAQKLGPKIDTRGVGGYILLPPSIVNGKPYEVLHDRELAPAPQSLALLLAATTEPAKASVEVLDLPGNVARARALLLGCVNRGDVATEGRGGDHRTYRLACEVQNLGVAPETALALIEELWNPHCVPPWTHEELEIKITNAAAYAQNEAGAWAVAPAAEVFGRAALALANDTRPERRSRFHFEDEDEMEQGEDPKWIVSNLIPEASTVLMVGKTGSFKSFVALELALAIATGTETFGASPLKGLTFYGALESRTNMKKARRRAWRIAREIEGRIDDFYIGPAPMIAMPDEVQAFGDEIAARCKGRKPKLIVLDTLAKCMAGLNENDAGDAGKFIRFCDSLVEAFGCSVVAIHHTGKDDARGARGSSAFHAGFDTVLEVKAHRATKAVEVWVRKHKDAEEPETPFTFEGKAVANSLVFFPTSHAEHRAISGEHNPFDAKAIGQALQALNAYGEEQAVTTHVLASQALEPVENESTEDREQAIARAVRSLKALARNKLEAYCARVGPEWRWSLPAPVKT